MSYSREEVKTITDKVLNMAKADGARIAQDTRVVIPAPAARELAAA